MNHPLFFTRLKKKKKIRLNFNLWFEAPITLVDLIIFLNTRYLGLGIFFNKKIPKKLWTFQVFFFCFVLGDGGGGGGGVGYLCVPIGVPNRFPKFLVCSSTCFPIAPQVLGVFLNMFPIAPQVLGVFLNMFP